MDNPETKESFKHLVRIANTDLEGKKQILYALTKIRGISYQMANAVCHVAGVGAQKRSGELSDVEIEKLDAAIRSPAKFDIPVWMYNRRKDLETGLDKHLVGPDLKFVQEADIRLMKKIKSYKGIRHSLGLPVRGQRTRSNFRKNKGKVLGVIRKTVVAAPPSEKEEKKK